jgi:hypothetical protein
MTPLATILNYLYHTYLFFVTYSIFIFIYIHVCVSVLCHSFYIDCAVCKDSLELNDQGTCYGCKQIICNPYTISVVKGEFFRKSGKKCSAEIVNVYRKNWSCAKVEKDLKGNINGDIQGTLVWCYRDTCKDICGEGFHVHKHEFGHPGLSGLHYGNCK